ncbi:MAG: ATP-binding protein [Bacteroidota bacterium]
MNHLKREINIKATFDEFAKVQKFLDEIFDYFHIPERIYGSVYLTVEEALRNAIVHGSKGNVTENVRILFKKTIKGISFVIQDPGEGFNVAEITRNRWEKEYEGNGIFLIKSLTDEFSYNQQGNKLTMSFVVSGIDPVSALSRAVSLGNYLSGKRISVK